MKACCNHMQSVINQELLVSFCLGSFNLEGRLSRHCPRNPAPAPRSNAHIAGLLPAKECYNKF